jgi:hypothetical protein
MKRKSFPKIGEERETVATVDPDLFLDQEKLIALAVQELRGKRPFVGRTGEGPHAEGMRNVELRQALQQKTLLQRELESRAWTTLELSKALRISESEALALSTGRTRINRKTAEALAGLFATSLEFWL